MDGEESEEGEEDQEGLDDGDAGEDEAEGVGGEEKDGYGCGEGCGPAGVAASDQQPGDDEDSGEDGDGEGAGGGERDAGELEDEAFEDRPDGERGGGVEVSGQVPLAALEVTDGGITVPAFVGVFGPVHPGGVVGEVGVEMKGVEGQEDRRDEEKGGLDGSDDLAGTQQVG